MGTCARRAVSDPWKHGSALQRASAGHRAGPPTRSTSRNSLPRSSATRYWSLETWMGRVHLGNPSSNSAQECSTPGRLRAASSLAQCKLVGNPLSRCHLFRLVEDPAMSIVDDLLASSGLYI